MRLWRWRCCCRWWECKYHNFQPAERRYRTFRPDKKPVAEKTCKNAVEFDRKRNVIWMQDGQKIKGKKDAIIDMLMLVAAECWHDYGEINEEDVEALQK